MFGLKCHLIDIVFLFNIITALDVSINTETLLYVVCVCDYNDSLFVIGHSIVWNGVLTCQLALL